MWIQLMCSIEFPCNDSSLSINEINIYIVHCCYIDTTASYGRYITNDMNLFRGHLSIPVQNQTQQNTIRVNNCSMHSTHLMINDE